MDQDSQQTQAFSQVDVKSLSCTTEPTSSELAPQLNTTISSSNTLKSPPKPQDAERIGHYARKAMKKALGKIVRYEKAVLQDTDIEALHQMRIGLRRLRTTIVTFEQVLAFPESVRDITLKPLAKRLGRVRDLDVLLLALRDRHRPHLPKKERKTLDKIISRLQTKRDRQFKRMKRFLLSKDYKTLKENVRYFYKQLGTPGGPTNQAASWPIQLALPDLLLPVLSQTLLHSGWLATPPGLSLGHVKGEGDDNAIALVNRWLDQDGTILHDLRKQIKQLRYQADFFAPQYDDTYGQHIKDFKTIQDVLGTFQDNWVLAQTLQQLDGPSWKKHLPSLYQQMQQDLWHTWQQWETIREQYISADMRLHLRTMMLHPLQPQ